MATKISLYLRKSLAVFGEEGERWGKGWFAYDSFGNRVDPDSPNAAQWCIAGSLNHICGKFSDTWNLAARYLADAAKFPNGQVFTDWNDAPERKFSDIKAVYEKAIELAEKEEAA